MTTQSTALRFADLLVASPRTFPGLYPRYAVTDDGGVLCPSCCASERIQIATTFKGDGWCVIGLETLWEPDDGLFCDHCGDQIR